MTHVAAWMPVWGRHTVLKAALCGYKEMAERWHKAGIRLTLHVAWTSNADADLVRQEVPGAGAMWYAPNRPLSVKHNALLRSILKEVDPDFYLQIGSDDVFLPRGDGVYFRAIAKGEDHIGTPLIYFVSPGSQEAMRYSYRTNMRHDVFGAGRMWSRRAVRAAFDGGELWPKVADKGLDTISQKRLESCGFDVRVIRNRTPYIVDIKNGEGLWGYDCYRDEGDPIEYGELLAEIPGSAGQHIGNVIDVVRVAQRNQGRPKWAEPA